MNPAGIFKVVSEVCVFVWSVYSPSRERGHVYHRSETLYTVLKFAHRLFWCRSSLPLFWLQACIIVQMIGLHRQYDRRPQHSALKCLVPLNFTQFLILLWMIKEACPIITHEKLTQPSVWTNWGSFVCFAVSQSRNLMFSPLRLGSCFPSFDQYFLWLKSVTSGWPSAPHMTPLTPAVSRCWSKALFVYSWQTALTSGETVQSVTESGTGANWANTAAVLYPEVTWLSISLVQLFDMIFFPRLAVKWDPVPLLRSPTAPPWTEEIWTHTWFLGCMPQ